MDYTSHVHPFAIKRVISIHLESRIATPSGRHEPVSPFGRGRAEEFHRLLGPGLGA